MDIKALEEQYKELQSYSDTQFHSMVELKKKVEELERENKHLKEMLEGNIPSLNLISNPDGLGISNEQLVCETQIALLKERAVTRELTMEESKKFQIFSNVLQELRKSGDNTEDAHVKKMTDNDLIKLLETNNGTSG